MKKNHTIIIYDDSCPLCAMYTNAFVQTGLLEKEGRKSFADISPELTGLIDVKKSANEIPLIDPVSRQVWYGIDALLEILGTKMPIVKRIGNIKPVKWILLKIYKLISFNRRVIVAGNQSKGSIDCTPDFNLRYRLLLMVIFLVFNTWLLYPLHQSFSVNSLLQNISIRQLQWAHIAVVAINIAIAVALGKKAGIEYLGQVNMVSTITLLLCVPLAIINRLVASSSGTVNQFYFGMLTIFMLGEYCRRMRFAGIIPQHRWVKIINLLTIGLFFGYISF